MNSRPRITSPSTIVQRRLSRSAMAPASGPSSTEGSSRKMKTPATARLALAYEPFDPAPSWGASAAVAGRPGGGGGGGRGGGGRAGPAAKAGPAEGQPEPAEGDAAQHGADVVFLPRHAHSRRPPRRSGPRPARRPARRPGRDVGQGG